MQILHKSFSLDLKAADDDTRTIEGWASTFGNVDSDDDIIAPGAFTESLKTKAPKMLWQHRSDQVIGIWEDCKETPQGLYVKGRILDTTLGNDAYKLAKAGAIDSMSIGFSTQEYSVNRDTGTRTIQKVNLWEVSLVTFPANDMARIMGVKSAHLTEREFESFLREAGYSRDAAKIITARGFKSLGESQREADEAIRLQREAEAKEIKELTNLFNSFTLEGISV